jgi:hypothetical protein
MLLKPAGKRVDHLGALGVVAHSADHPGAPAQAGGGNCLVGALAARLLLKNAPADGLAGAGKRRGLSTLAARVQLAQKCGTLEVPNHESGPP